MSADAWRVCPQCIAHGTLKKTELKQKAAEVYGKVSIAEFDGIRQEELDAEEEEPECTLREDYEIFMQEDGKLYIDYGCSCSVCGFSANLKSEDQYPITLEKKEKKKK